MDAPATIRAVLLVASGLTTATTLTVALRYAALPTRSHQTRHVVSLGLGTCCVLLYAMRALYEFIRDGKGWSLWMVVMSAGLLMILYGLYQITGTLRRGP